VVSLKLPKLLSQIPKSSSAEVHQIRNSLKYVSYKDRKTVAANLKSIYQSVSEEEARMRPEMGFTVSLYQQKLAIKLGKPDKPIYYQCD